MAQYTITEEQIMSIAEGGGKKKIKEMFPQVFNTKLEVGKWYKSESLLGVYNSDEITYGFFEGKFGNEWLMTDNGFYTPATN